MMSVEQKDWRYYLLRTGVVLFLMSLPTMIIGSMAFGKIGVAWPTILMAYPALMVIGAVVGASDLFYVLSAWREGRLSEDGPVFVFFIIARGLVLTQVFFVFLWMEVKAVTELRALLA